MPFGTNYVYNLSIIKSNDLYTEKKITKISEEKRGDMGGISHFTTPKAEDNNWFKSGITNFS